MECFQHLLLITDHLFDFFLELTDLPLHLLRLLFNPFLEPFLYELQLIIKQLLLQIAQVLDPQSTVVFMFVQ